MPDVVPITVAKGDGIGPEIIAATMYVLEAAGARIAPESIEVGERVYLQGVTSGIGPQAWESIRRTGILLKGPITTPQGGGYKSLNVSIRKLLGLYANVRPCVAYSPFIATNAPTMDVVIIRENEEDLYAGIEHRQTDEVYQCLKLITRPGCEKIVRYAFEYALRNGRKLVTCMTKDNIMKMTDGLFHQVFEEIAAEYPTIAAEHLIVDIGAAMLACKPERFDVIVTLNLYGDILSDIAAQVAGSVGLAPSSNVGQSAAMFEAIHGSAPAIAGKDEANPSGLMLASVMMLNHIGQADVAARIHNAWLRTIEDGYHTGDIYDEKLSWRLATTQGFARAVTERLGREPKRLAPVSYSILDGAMPVPGASTSRPVSVKKIVGVDVFLHWRAGPPEALAVLVQATTGASFRLELITNRGVRVWPDGLPETSLTDHWRCRFVAREAGAEVERKAILGLLDRVDRAGLDFIKTEHLCTFDGKPGFSLGQGQ